MTGFPPELIYLLIFGAVLLFNFVLKKAARRQQEIAARNAPPEEEIPKEEWNAVPVVPPPVAPPPMAPPPAAQAGKRLRVARQSLFGARWDRQEAVVVATILGRCRADEPHDVP